MTDAELIQRAREWWERTGEQYRADHFTDKNILLTGDREFLIPAVSALFRVVDERDELQKSLTHLHHVRRTERADLENRIAELEARLKERK